MNSPPKIALAPGQGFLVRGSGELLFVPSPAATLVDAFRDASPGTGFNAVTLLVETNPGSSDFAIVSWASTLRVAVFGDIEIVSNHASLPRLSGAGVGTWVERTVRSSVGAIEIGVNDEAVVDSTDLQAGVVLAGGFRFSCELSPVPEAQTVGCVEADSAPVPIGSLVAEAPEDVPVDPLPAGVSDRLDRPEFRAEAPVDDGMALRSPPVRRLREPVAADSNAVAAPSDEKPIPDVPAAPEERSFFAGPTDATMVPSAEVLEVVAELVGGETTDAVPTGGSFRIVFDSDRVVDVGRPLLLGRSPTPTPDLEAQGVDLVEVDCRQVSGTHLKLTPSNSSVEIVDMGSRNGTWMVATGDGQPLRLEPHKVHFAGEGTVVKIGTQNFVVRAVTRTGS